MNPQPTDGGLPIQWDPVECSTYIVLVVGNQERFPECNPYHPGAMMLQTRLHHRYGEDYAKSCSKLLRAFLEDLETGTPEERSIWHDWRLAHQAKVVRLRLSLHRPECQRPCGTGIEVAGYCTKQEQGYCMVRWRSVVLSIHTRFIFCLS